MPRLMTPEAPRDLRPGDAARDALDAAREALENARKAVESARSSAADSGGQVADRLPRPAEVLAAVPGAIELSRRIPSLREVRAAAEDARIAARDAAVDAARRTPLRDHPAVRRGPGPMGIVARLGLASVVAGIVGLLIVNRDRVREMLIEARTRAARMAAERGAYGAAGSGTWSSSDTGYATPVDDVLLVETSSTSIGSLPSDQPAQDLDAEGWGVEGQPTAPRQLSSDVAALTTPSRTPDLPDELGE